MTKAIKPTKQFKKQFRKRKQDPKWRKIFKGELPAEIDTQKRSPWQFITECLINEQAIPEYFYPHALVGLTGLEKQIKKQLGNTKLKVVILELHFDGHSGDHLLIYIPTDEKVFLAGIGTHSDLF